MNSSDSTRANIRSLSPAHLPGVHLPGETLHRMPDPRPQTTPDRVMQPEHFTQVIEAILAGKYSWACVLILRFSGYNPLHYIPYRTYNRIVKDNVKDSLKDNPKDNGVTRTARSPQPPIQAPSKTTVPPAGQGQGKSTRLGQITDLDYLETLDHPTAQNATGSGRGLIGRLVDSSALRAWAQQRTRGCQSDF
jgi:hypothetical protein